MRLIAFAAATLSLCLSLVSAGVVRTPIRPDQVVPKTGDDCFFGVTTPQGCGYVLTVSLDMSWMNGSSMTTNYVYGRPLRTS